MKQDGAAARLTSGQPPLKVSELAEIVGYSDRWIQKLMNAGVLVFVRPRPGGQRRIPVSAAARLARELGVFRG